MAKQSLNQFLLSSKGRVSRMQYNVYFIIPFAVVNWLLMEVPKWFQDDLQMLFTVSMVTTVLSIVAMWSFVAVTNKRLHDRGASGWRQLGYAVLSVIGILVALKGVKYNISPEMMSFSYDVVSPVMVYLGGVIAVVPMLVDLCVLKGTTGENKYGPDPLQTEENE